MYIQSYLYNPKLYHIVGSDSKYSGKWQRRKVPFGFTDQNVVRSLPRHNFFSQLCRKLPPEILKDLYESWQQSGRKHKCTPLKAGADKSWFFTWNTPKIFAPPSARRIFFKCAPPNLKSWIRPWKGSTTKRKRHLSPGTPSSISGSYDTVVIKFK
jgi:hypothetical protein